ncbi:hypothetical protein GCM10018966_094830 [Streptomyces yanii]
MPRDEAAERAALRGALSELNARLATNTERGPGARHRFEPLVERLRTPAAAFLRPELECRLARHVAVDDSFARDGSPMSWRAPAVRRPCPPCCARG